MSTMKELSFAALLVKHAARLPAPVSDMLRDLLSMISDLNKSLVSLMSQGLLPSDNFDWQKITLTTNGSANTEDAVAHTLKRIPEGFIVITKDKAADVYASGTAWTDSQIFLKTSVVSATITIYVF